MGGTHLLWNVFTEIKMGKQFDRTLYVGILHLTNDILRVCKTKLQAFKGHAFFFPVTFTS